MRRRCVLPSVRQQLFESACWLDGQALEDVLEVAVRIVPVEFRGLDEAHDVAGTLTGAKRSGEQPVGAAERHHAVILPMSGKKL